MINDSKFSDYKYNGEFIIKDMKACVWSISNINIGNEIYINYGDSYWKYR